MVQKFAPGAYLEVTRGQKVGFWVPFFIVTQLLLSFLARTLKLSQVIAPWMRKDWRKTFGILMLPLGQGQGCVALKGPKFILYKYSPVAY